MEFIELEELVDMEIEKSAFAAIRGENGLPEGWEIKKLGEVCEKISNGSSAKQFEEEVGFPISRIETIWNSEIDYKRVKYIYENDADFVSKYALKNNDILFSHINSDIHLGKTAVYKKLPNKELIHGINLLLIRPNEQINSDFLNYQLKFLRARGKFISIAQKSVNQSSINQAKLKQVDLVVPHISEQQKIVSKIEELFSELDKGKQQLETAREQLKIYRQSVLKWAFEGKLTNSFTSARIEPEDVTAKEFEPNVLGVGVEPNLPDGWKWVQMGEVIEKPKYGTSKKCDYNIEGKGVLRIPNIGEGIVNSLDLKFAYFDNEEIQSYKLKEGDLLTIRSNGSVDLVGKCALISKKDEEFLYAGYLIRLRPLHDKINSKYLLYNLMSSNLRNQIENKAKSTSGVNNINTDELKSLILPLSHISEQQKIVEEIESRLSVADKVEETISQSLQQAETLRQSILKQAFEGKLI